MGIAEEIRESWGPEKYAQCLAAREVVPGPKLVGELPSPDPWAYPVHCGPAARFPELPGPILPSRDPMDYPVHCGPRAFLPSPVLSFARPEPEEDGPYPAPEVTSRDGVAGPEKRAVRDLVRDLEAAGWEVVVTYARGSWPNAATGHPGAPKDSLAVRMSKPGIRAAAVYAGPAKGAWNWLTLAIREEGKVQRRFEKITQFREAVL